MRIADLDLNSAEVFLIDQSMVCLGLFAISAGDFALSADLCRSVLKRQKLQADAGVWIMRGLAFAGMGKKYSFDIICYNFNQNTFV